MRTRVPPGQPWRLIAGCLSLCIALALLAPRPAAAIPPRPPRPSPTPTAQAASRTLITLHLDLGAAPAPWQGLWTVVEWQDAAGGWHEVEGWQGTLDRVFQGRGKKTWAVGEQDLGRGPFRWLVYDQRQGSLLAASAAFNLPSLAGDILEISTP